MAKRLDLDAIEARAEAATKGPWDVFEHYCGSCTVAQMRSCDKLICVNAHEHGLKPYLSDAANAVFIAAARTDVPALCAEVRRLQERVDELDVACDECPSQHWRGKVRRLEAVNAKLVEACEATLVGSSGWMLRVLDALSQARGSST
jgi:hypothetical protein